MELTPVVNYIELLLNDLSPDGFRDLLRTLLARPGRILSPTTPAQWPVVVASLAQRFGGPRDAAVVAAAAVEFAVAAIDVTDDLVDGAQDIGCPWRQSLVAGDALGQLAHCCVLALEAWLPAERVRSIRDVLTSGMLASCSGQYLDLETEGQPISMELAEETTRRKSAALMAMACQIATLVATSDAQIVELARQFGVHIGMIAQLANDSDGIDPSVATLGEDLRNGKRHPVIVYALFAAEQAQQRVVLDWAEQPVGQLDEAAIQRVADAMRDLGALQFAWVTAVGYRQHALNVITQLVAATGRDDLREPLEALVPSLGLRPA
jgi:geranylgeranyl pyrophosphate synthase